MSKTTPLGAGGSRRVRCPSHCGKVQWCPTIGPQSRRWERCQCGAGFPSGVCGAGAGLLPSGSVWRSAASSCCTRNRAPTNQIQPPFSPCMLCCRRDKQILLKGTLLSVPWRLYHGSTIANKFRPFEDNDTWQISAFPLFWLLYEQGSHVFSGWFSCHGVHGARAGQRCAPGSLDKC